MSALRTAITMYDVRVASVLALGVVALCRALSVVPDWCRYKSRLRQDSRCRYAKSGATLTFRRARAKIQDNCNETA